LISNVHVVPVQCGALDPKTALTMESRQFPENHTEIHS
jgi:hypothetical protein